MSEAPGSEPVGSGLAAERVRRLARVDELRQRGDQPYPYRFDRTHTLADVRSNWGALEPGSPHAVRAVGTACALNPLPLVVPCHRVVRSDGTPGQYAGGAEVKRRLLALERQSGPTAGSLR